mmetsp:Transcript_92263/g.287574  ORF Transcript_92263/g.287574 Transcript_92263/m.287574 type:complete len:224 (-) Transcript_92263:117-788(-)
MKEWSDRHRTALKWLRDHGRPSQTTMGQMENVEEARAVIVSGPGKSPPMFNLLLGIAKQSNVAVAMVYKPGFNEATDASLSWESDYAFNVGRAAQLNKKLLVILHDDGEPGGVQKLEMNFMKHHEVEFEIMLLQQFLGQYCGGPREKYGHDGFEVEYRKSDLGVIRWEGDYNTKQGYNRVEWYPGGTINLCHHHDGHPQSSNKTSWRSMQANGEVLQSALFDE